MTKRRKMSNLLALAVLALLNERPMHPYEMAFEMRTRHLEGVIKLNYGSLYSVVEALEREGLIVPRETVREGRRPERTVYALTDAGHGELNTWLRELLRTPAKEYPRFAAGLALLGHLPVEDATALLKERAHRLEAEIDQAQFILDTCLRGSQGRTPVPRLFLLEIEYGLMLRESELHWVRRIIAEIENGTLVWPRPDRCEAGAEAP